MGLISFVKLGVAPNLDVGLLYTYQDVMIDLWHNECIPYTYLYNSWLQSFSQSFARQTNQIIVAVRNTQYSVTKCLHLRGFTAVVKNCSAATADDLNTILTWGFYFAVLKHAI